MKKKFTFKKITSFKNARVGKILTSKGKIDTPAFMPVGTQGTVKSVFIDDLILCSSCLTSCNR